MPQTEAAPIAIKAGEPRRLANPIRAIAALPSSSLLAGCGLLMTAIFYFGFTQRYSLAEHGYKPMQSIATLNGMAASGAIIYVLGFAALFALYGLGLRYGLRAATPFHGVMVAAFALIFNLSLLQMAPVDAADIYDNIVRGRMSAVYGLNPLHDLPTQVRQDSFYGFAAWHEVPSAYGPVWESLAAGLSRLAGDDHNTNVLVFKGLSVVGYAVTALFIGLILLKIAPAQALRGVYLFAWSPLVIYMTGAGGHNDTVMTACMVISIYYAVRRWYVASILGALLGALIKFIPALLIPFIVIVAFRDLRGARRVQFFALSALAGAALIIGCYAPYWTGLATLSIERRGSMFTSSAATLIRQGLSQFLDGHSTDDGRTPNTNAVVGRVMLLGFALFYLNQLVAAYRRQTPPNLPQIMTAVLLFYLLIAALWFQAWYVLWVLAMAVLLDGTPLLRLTLFFSYLVTWQPIIYNYLTLRPGNWAPLPWRDLIPIAVVMGPAWGYVAWWWLSDRRRAKISAALVNETSLLK